jgi:cation/acetate symporter
VRFLGLEKWFGIADVSAGLFGITAGFATIVAVSLLTPEPPRQVRQLVAELRYPHLGRPPKPEAAAAPLE